METMETASTVVIGDFEVGSRVYREAAPGEQPSSPVLGTVIGVHGYQSNLEVKFDDGKFRLISINDFGPRKQYGKCLDLSLIEVGSVLSGVYGDDRSYVTVTEYTPGESVTLKPHDRSGNAYVRASEGEPLEYLLSDWELEY